MCVCRTLCHCTAHIDPSWCLALPSHCRNAGTARQGHYIWFLECVPRIEFESLEFYDKHFDLLSHLLA